MLAPTTEAAAPGSGALGRKLVWITLYRLVVVTLLLGVTAFHEWLVGTEQPTPLYGLILATYVASIAYAMLLRQRRWLAPLALVQVALDVVLAVAVVGLTGRAESPFVFLLSLAPVNGGVLLYRRGAALATALTVAAYLALVLWPGAPRAPGITLFLHVGAFAATAVLAAYLAEQLRDTGERLAAREVDLAAITALHESIVQSVTSGIVTLDPAGRVTFLNAAGEAITGLTLREVRGAPAERWFSAFHAMTSRDETEFVNARGERLRIGYTRFPLHERGGRALGHAVIFQDLTRLREMEAAVQRTARLADLGQLAAGLAHELRNPLASMSGSIELLRASAGEGDARLMDIVLREAARLDDLVTRFLAFSRPSPPRREPVDLSRVAAETLEVFANDPAAVRVRVDRALGPAPAFCDAGQVRQVLWNLLANAAHAAGERHASEGEGGARGTVWVRTGAGEGGAWLEVEDDGAGIPASDLPLLFTPFRTTKAQGTGLGLAIVQRIADAHGGEVRVDSPPGRGARFTVRFPTEPAVG